MKLVFKFGKYFQNMDVLITFLSGTAFDKISFCNFRLSFSVRFGLPRFAARICSYSLLTTFVTIHPLSPF